LRRGLRHSNPATESGRTGPLNRRRTKLIHFAGDFRDSCRPSVRQSRREARGSVGGNLPNRLANRIRPAARPPAALHGPTPGARNRFWRLPPSSWPLWGQHYGGQAQLATPPPAGGKQPINPLR